MALFVTTSLFRTLALVSRSCPLSRHGHTGTMPGTGQPLKIKVVGSASSAVRELSGLYVVCWPASIANALLALLLQQTPLPPSDLAAHGPMPVLEILFELKARDKGDEEG